MQNTSEAIWTVMAVMPVTYNGRKTTERVHRSFRWTREHAENIAKVWSAGNTTKYMVVPNLDMIVLPTPYYGTPARRKSTRVDFSAMRCLPAVAAPSIVPKKRAAEAIA